MHLKVVYGWRFTRFLSLFALVGVVFPLCLPAQTSSGPSLAITTDSLPEAYTSLEYRAQLTAAGGIPPYKWSIESGELPKGLFLDATSGAISGIPASSEDAPITVQVSDSSVPAHSITQQLKLPMLAALVLEWVQPPHVQTNRIDGAVRVSNGSRNDYDMTVIIVGINATGRATALGYQRFVLKAKSVGPDIPFGITLPDGSYVVHADAVAEIVDRKWIVKQMLQTPAALKIATSP